MSKSIKFKKGDIIRLVSAEGGMSFDMYQYGVFDSFMNEGNYNVYPIEDNEILGIYVLATEENMRPILLNPQMFVDNGFIPVLGKFGELTFEKMFPPGYKGVYYPYDEILRIFAKKRKEERASDNEWEEWYFRHVKTYDEMQHIISKFRDPLSDTFNNFKEEHVWRDVFSIKYARGGKPYKLIYTSAFGTFTVGMFIDGKFVNDPLETGDKFLNKYEFTKLQQNKLPAMQRIRDEYQYDIDNIVNFFLNIYRDAK